jgi:RecB family endonuclease NucS
MPIEVAIWEVTNNTINKIVYSTIDSENKLEKIIKKDISIISDDLLLIGNQVRTIFGKFIDILAVNSEGKLSVIELKKGLDKLR